MAEPCPMCLGQKHLQAWRNDANGLTTSPVTIACPECSPAPGAEAMREALESYDYWIENATTGSDRAALRRASDALADYVRCALPLPAPEVPSRRGSDFLDQALNEGDGVYRP